MNPAGTKRPVWGAWLTVVILTLIAAVLRIAGLQHAPPGLNQDEAINAWNAWSLVRTGRDMIGEPWPIFYFHSIADNRTPLFIYWLVPFHALLGLDVWPMRLAAAAGGVVCVPLIYWCGARLFDRRVGLVAAAMLVLNPWHLSSTRWAIDGTIVPMLSLATLAALLWADLPFSRRDGQGGRPWAAAVAGLVAGITCYGYWALRLHVPILLALAVLLTWRGWRERWRSRAGRAGVLAFALGFAVTFGPLAIEHLRDPAIAIRAEMTRLWEPGTPLHEIAARIAARYAVHFGPAFLYVRGDRDPGNAPADSGAFEWSMLPLMLIGLAVVLRRFRASASHAFLLAMVLAYPAGDLVARYEGVHAFRSSPGMIGLVLLAAVGAGAGWRWIRGRTRAGAMAAAAAFAAATLVQDARSLHTYFTSWRDRPPIYALFHADFMQAVDWVKPRLDEVDAVFWTARGVNMPFALTLVGLDYDPARWATDVKDVRRNIDGWDIYVRYRNHYFLYGDLVRPYVDDLRAGGRRVRAMFVVRPNELGLTDPVHVIRGPDGTERLWICTGEL